MSIANRAHIRRIAKYNLNLNRNRNRNRTRNRNRNRNRNLNRNLIEPRNRHSLRNKRVVMYTKMFLALELTSSRTMRGIACFNMTRNDLDVDVILKRSKAELSILRD